MASKIAQDSPTWLKTASDMPPRRPQRATKRFQVLLETPQDPSKRVKSVKSQRNINLCCLLAFSLPVRL
eukprot:1841565-Pyramimonas_sp.AAC.1